MPTPDVIQARLQILAAQALADKLIEQARLAEEVARLLMETDEELAKLKTAGATPTNTPGAGSS